MDKVQGDSREELDVTVKHLKTGWKFIFQQNSYPRYKGKAAIEWFARNKEDVPDWPSQSPDLYPIEKLWNDVKIDDHRQTPINLSRLEQFSKEVWGKISKSRCGGSVNREKEKIQEQCTASAL